MAGCTSDNSDEEYPNKRHAVVFPGSPANLSEFNTEFDDYNLAGPIIDGFHLFFSSNRHSHGRHFDIVKESIKIIFDYHSGDLSIQNTDYPVYQFDCLDEALPLLNTESNQFGPYIAPFVEDYNSMNCNEFIFLYADDQLGSLDIKFLFRNEEDNDNIELYGADLLNSEYDDAYPTLNGDKDKIYFTSNRDTNFDIYEVDISDFSEIKEILKDASLAGSCVKVESISSVNNDKCPFISGNLLVFVSDREGGYGGYDLWYSNFENGGWTAPVNFGENINSEFDEYRPVVQHFNEFENALMIFSSNRPGGKGGFDLYYVGI